MGRKGNKNQGGFDGSYQSKASHGSEYDRGMKAHKHPKKHDHSDDAETSYIRKQVDPEIAKYFSDIANLLEGGEIGADEHPIICSNALEESRGKEVELVTDYILSHTMQTLLEGCDADHLCGFLRSCAKSFDRIATDRSGSHVAETALNSLVSHLHDQDLYNLIKDTLTLICQEIVRKPVAVMCNCYGSHVFRSLLCLCKGVPLNSEFHSAKSSTVLSRRLNLMSDKERKNGASIVYQGFPDLLEFLVSEMLKCSTKDIAALQVDQYSSLVLQASLKLLAGQEQVLLHTIPVIMGCNVESGDESSFIETTKVQNIRDLVKENAFSHLMEVILELAPDTLYDEIFMKVFKDSLYDLSCHQSANFAVQALISHARSSDQVNIICEEIGSKMKNLLAMGRSGVIASLIAASERLHACEHKCAKALAAAVMATNEAPKCIVPRILLLENYFYSNDKANWSWTSGCKIHVMGSLILQSLFKYPIEYIQPYFTSITSMENVQILEALKDAAGARVFEAFLGSKAPDKQKKKLISKLKGHFGELAMHPSGTFTVEKCFNVSDVPIREIIVSELLSVQKDLSKTRQGPLLLRNLDADGFSRRPEQWRSRQKSKINVYKEFLAEFVDEDIGLSEKKNPPVINSSKKAAVPEQTNTIKKMRQEIDSALASFTSPDPSKKHKKHKETRKGQTDNNVEQKPSSGKKKRKHHQEDDSSKTSMKKLKS
ncbi:pumilio homolog 23 [Amaranthus tricolor]|uniref:pumilio homolog 23 n=1 Tax=Amaranthus tricolor TaxID=29722 RepID=UPI002589C39F|nr:pumilio homolog 23 [Amaranthus tricolor]